MFSRRRHHHWVDDISKDLFQSAGAWYEAEE